MTTESISVRARMFGQSLTWPLPLPCTLSPTLMRLLVAGWWPDEREAVVTRPAEARQIRWAANRQATAPSGGYLPLINPTYSPQDGVPVPTRWRPAAPHCIHALTAAHPAPQNVFLPSGT